jgi:hypothetical protein
MKNKQLQLSLRSFFADKDGKKVIWQKPNFLLVGWFVFMVTSKLFRSKTIKPDLEIISTVFLLAWAVLEITKGINIFRRFLGATVLIFTIYSRLH